MQAVRLILEKGSKLISNVDEVTYDTDENVINTAVVAQRLDIAKYLLEHGFRKPPSAVISALDLSDLYFLIYLNQFYITI